MVCPLWETCNMICVKNCITSPNQQCHENSFGKVTECRETPRVHPKHCRLSKRSVNIYWNDLFVDAPMMPLYLVMLIYVQFYRLWSGLLSRVWCLNIIYGACHDMFTPTRYIYLEAMCQNYSHDKHRVCTCQDNPLAKQAVYWNRCWTLTLHVWLINKSHVQATIT